MPTNHEPLVLYRAVHRTKHALVTWWADGTVTAQHFRVVPTWNELTDQVDDKVAPDGAPELLDPPPVWSAERYYNHTAMPSAPIDFEYYERLQGDHHE